MESSPAPHACNTFEEVAESGQPVRPLDFPPPVVRRGVRVDALVIHPATGRREVLAGVIHREDLQGGGAATSPPSGSPGRGGLTPTTAGGGWDTTIQQPVPQAGEKIEYVAYWPQRRLQDAIYGSVWACLLLKRHYGPAADDAARAAGVAPGSPSAPIVWEIVGTHVAIKMVEWARVHRARGRLLEDPIKEIAAMQLLGARHPHVLGSSEVLQDDDYLFSIMPYCSGGDLFGVVVAHAEESGGDGGMSEPIARYWFRQILQVSYVLWLIGLLMRSSRRPIDTKPTRRLLPPLSHHISAGTALLTVHGRLPS